jgi:hypothetical protein
MNHRKLSRWIAAIVMVFVFAFAMYLDEGRRGKMGREAFLEKQAVRYDKFYVNPPLATDILGALLVGRIFLAVYEVVAYGTLMLLDRTNPNE